MRRPVLLSIILHFVFFAAVFLIVRRRPLLEKPPTEPTFNIVLEEGPKGKGSSEAPAGTTQGKAKRERHEKKGGKDLAKKKGPVKRHLNLGLVPMPFSDGRSTTRSSGGPSGPGGPEGQIYGPRLGKPDGYDHANGMGVEREGKLYPFFQAIWRKVDAVTTYPKDFVDQRIKGKATVQLVVDRRGVFTGEIRSVHGDESMLNTFVLALLVHVLRTPLPENLRMNGEDPQASDRMLLVFQFDFDLFGPGGIPRKEEYAHLKNVMNFRRDSYVDPAINKAIEKFFTRYMPPIIVIPGGFYIDFVRAYQFVKNMSSPPKPDEDELRVRRLEMDKEKWERIIQKSTNG